MVSFVKKNLSFAALIAAFTLAAFPAFRLGNELFSYAGSIAFTYSSGLASLTFLNIVLGYLLACRNNGKELPGDYFVFYRILVGIAFAANAVFIGIELSHANEQVSAVSWGIECLLLIALAGPFRTPIRRKNLLWFLLYIPVCNVLSILLVLLLNR